MHLSKSARQYDAFVRTRHAATHSYVGYDVQIARLREPRRRRSAACRHVDSAAGTHDRRTVAITSRGPPGTPGGQQAEARFGVADSYDRAARAQSGVKDNDVSPPIPMVLRRFSWSAAPASNKPFGDGGDAGGAAERASGRAGGESNRVSSGMFNTALPRGDTGDRMTSGGRCGVSRTCQLEKQFGIRAGSAKPRGMASEARPGIRELAGRQSQSGLGSCQRAFCRNPIRISSGARQRRPESWRQ